MLVYTVGTWLTVEYVNSRAIITYVLRYSCVSKLSQWTVLIHKKGAQFRRMIAGLPQSFIILFTSLAFLRNYFTIVTVV